MTAESTHLSIAIARPASVVYEYAGDPANLPQWAAGLAESAVERVDGEWVADAPMGRVTVAFAERNDLGVLDHVVTFPTGESVCNPLRVIPDGDGSEVVFTLRRRPGMSGGEFRRDVDAVRADLEALKRIVEVGPVIPTANTAAVAADVRQTDLGSASSEEYSGLMIRIYPDDGHPSSLWPSKELVKVRTDKPYVLPRDIGIDEVFGARILAWTDRFQESFVEERDGFASRPYWRPGVNPFDWYDEGYAIVDGLRARFPGVRVRPEFAGYVFSVNERRESVGLLPVSLPGEPQAGFVSITDLVELRRNR